MCCICCMGLLLHCMLSLTMKSLICSTLLCLISAVYPSLGALNHQNPSSPPSPMAVPFAPLARLSNLSISHGGKLVPEFNELVFNYTTILGPHVKKFTVTVNLPQEEVDKHYAASLDSMPLKSGMASPLLRLGKRGENVTFHIFVTAINHRPSSYLLVARRETNGTWEVAEKILTIVGIALVAFVAGAVFYLAYESVCGRRLFGSFQLFRCPRDTSYEPIVTDESYFIRR